MQGPRIRLSGAFLRRLFAICNLRERRGLAFQNRTRGSHPSPSATQSVLQRNSPILLRKTPEMPQFRDFHSQTEPEKAACWTQWGDVGAFFSGGQKLSTVSTRSRGERQTITNRSRGDTGLTLREPSAFRVSEPPSLDSDSLNVGNIFYFRQLTARHLENRNQSDEAARTRSYSLLGGTISCLTFCSESTMNNWKRLKLCSR
jgi:hypothetical protein